MFINTSTGFTNYKCFISKKYRDVLVLIYESSKERKLDGVGPVDNRPSTD